MDESPPYNTYRDESPPYDTYRGLATFNSDQIRREDNPHISIFLQRIEQFRLFDILEIVKGSKSHSLGTVIGHTRKKLKVLLDDGEITTVYPKNTRLIDTFHNLPPGVIIPNTSVYNHSRICLN